MNSNEIIIAALIGLALYILSKYYVLYWKQKNLKYTFTRTWPKGTIYYTVMNSTNAKPMDPDPEKAIPKEIIADPSEFEIEVIKSDLDELNVGFRERGIDINFVHISEESYRKYHANEPRYEIIFLKDVEGSEAYLDGCAGMTSTWPYDGIAPHLPNITRGITYLRQHHENADLIFMHEVFHFLGLNGHVNSRKSMMYDVPLIYSPSESDYDIIKAKYKKD